MILPTCYAFLPAVADLPSLNHCLFCFAHIELQPKTENFCIFGSWMLAIFAVLLVTGLGLMFRKRQQCKMLVSFVTPTGGVNLMPVKASRDAAGYDLKAAAAVVDLMPGEIRIISSGIRVAIPQGYYLRLAERSGLARIGIWVRAGTIDADYRGVVGVMLHNGGTAPWSCAAGDRIAQGILEKYCNDCDLEVVADLPATARGVGGFGSTGLKST